MQLGGNKWWPESQMRVLLSLLSSQDGILKLHHHWHRYQLYCPGYFIVITVNKLSHNSLQLLCLMMTLVMSHQEKTATFHSTSCSGFIVFNTLFYNVVYVMGGRVLAPFLFRMSKLLEFFLPKKPYNIVMWYLRASKSLHSFAVIRPDPL